MLIGVSQFLKNATGLINLGDTRFMNSKVSVRSWQETDGTLKGSNFND